MGYIFLSHWPEGFQSCNPRTLPTSATGYHNLMAQFYCWGDHKLMSLNMNHAQQKALLLWLTFTVMLLYTLPAEKRSHQSHTATNLWPTRMTCLQEKQCCNSGTKVMGISNHFLIRYKPHSMRQSPCLTYQWGQDLQLDRSSSLGESLLLLLC